MDVGSDSTCLYHVLPIGTLVWRPSQILQEKSTVFFLYWHAHWWVIALRWFLIIITMSWSAPLKSVYGFQIWHVFTELMVGNHLNVIDCRKLTLAFTFCFNTLVWKYGCAEMVWYIFVSFCMGIQFWMEKEHCKHIKFPYSWQTQTPLRDHGYMGHISLIFKHIYRLMYIVSFSIFRGCGAQWYWCNHIKSYFPLDFYNCVFFSKVTITMTCHFLTRTWCIKAVNLSMTEASLTVLSSFEVDILKFIENFHETLWNNQNRMMTDILSRF